MFNSRQLLPLMFCGVLLGSGPLPAQSLDDPMRPPSEAPDAKGTNGAAKAAAASKGSDFYLSAIRISKTQRSATINGKSVGIGERIGNATVVAIQGSNVTLRQAGKTRTLSLLPLSIKTPVEAKKP